MTQEVTPSQAALDMARQIIGQGAWDAIQGNKSSLTLVQGLARFEEQTRTATEREVVARCAAMFDRASSQIITVRDASPFHSVSHDALTTYAVNLSGWAANIRALSEQKS